MDGKRAFEPGDMVTSFTGHLGMVIDQDTYTRIRSTRREGKRPGHYFAPGCCQNPDYVTQVPVLFEDGTYDVMRAINIRKAPEFPAGKKEAIQRLAQGKDDE